MHFCNQCKHFAEPSILLDKTPIKVDTEAKFLCVIFDWTVSYSCHVNYLNTNCFKALDIWKVVGHIDWGTDQKTLLFLYLALVRSHLDYGCIVYGAASNNILKKLPDPSPRLTNCSRSFSYFSCSKRICESTRDVFEKQTQETVFEKQTQETVYELCFKTKNLSW